MRSSQKSMGMVVIVATVLGGCGGSSSDSVALASNTAINTPTPANSTSAPATNPAANTGSTATGTEANTSPSAVADSTSQSMPNEQMQAVLAKLAALGAKPVELLTVQQARTQPTVADAVKAVLTEQGRSTDPEPVAKVEDRSFPGPAGEIPITVYTPAGNGPFPVVLYIHGGGWVIADRKVYDSSARALANASGAIVVSTDYRQGPENRFPAAHDDTFAAYQWVRENAVQFNGDPARIAVAGESAGGNMAASIAIRARDQRVPMPKHQVLIYPITNYAFDTPSQRVNVGTKPLSTVGLLWFYDRYLNTVAEGTNPIFSVLRSELSGLPSATVITADIDPLRSEGAAYAQRLMDAGVKVDYRNYPGVTHEFFGTGAVVDAARQAVNQAAAGLKTAFGD